MSQQADKTIADLLAVMAALRTPKSGCPWDLAQTFETIAPYTIEEAYEVAEAIAGGDRCELKEELGDLLLQVVYHARMAEEEGSFTFADVVAAITAKMLRRHPHVFGTSAERAAGAAAGFWERIKDREKRERAEMPQAGDLKPAPAVGKAERAPGGGGQRLAEQSILADVPIALPALTRAVKLQDKAARVGFDWPSLVPVIDKLKEELAELEGAISRAQGGKNPAQTAAVAEEYGDLLFVIANLARHLKIDPEASLRAANAKFIRRFDRIAELLAAAGLSPPKATLADMNRAWEAAKAEERKGPAER